MGIVEYLSLMITITPTMASTYDLRLVALSVLIAIVASYAALDLAGRVTSSRGLLRTLWLVGGSIAMGIGIWSMHYIGMLALKLPIPVEYDWPTVLLSLLSAIFASGVALVIVSGPTMGRLRAFWGSLFMGSGIAAMHYIGMAAMRMPAMCHYSLPMVTLSILVAVAVSFVALFLTFHVRGDVKPISWVKLLSAIVMGAAIPLKHYTGMAAVTFTSHTDDETLSHALRISSLELTLIVIVSLLGLGIVLLTSLVDRRGERTTGLLGAIVDSSDDGIISKNLDGLITSWNKSAERLFGYSAREAIGQHIRIIIPPNLQNEESTILERLKRGEGIEHFETIRVQKSGAQLDISLTISPIKDSAGRVIGASKIARDITQKKRAEEALRRAEEKYRAIFEDAVIGIFQTTPEGCPLSINRSLARMHGYDSPGQFMAEVSNVATQMFVEPGRLADLAQLISEQGIVRSAEIEVYCRDRKRKWMLVSLRGVRDAAGSTVLYEGTVEDITDRKVAEERVQFLAYYDALTALPNRSLLNDRLATALASARRRNDKVAVLFIDLDRFKVINDSLGHSTGDLLLQDVSGRLKRCAREHDTVARMGGDEFILVMTSIKDVADAAVACSRIVKEMTTVFMIQDKALSVTCSVGVSIFPDHGADVETLIRNADAAMYLAKENGRNNFRFFTNDMNLLVMERLALENDLRLALPKGQFMLVYQPQMDIASGRISGMEALIRWQHPELGLVSPDRFIRIAENSGLIIPIGEWVLRTACAQARKWLDEGVGTPISVNVSAVQLRQERFLETVKNILAETGLPPEYLELELTESLLLSNADLMFLILKELKIMGLKLAIDDFGTGYSSLSYLKQFPVSRLKIDRSFIRDLATSADDKAIATAIIHMAKSLGLNVIAEGVDSEAQMEFLRKHSCDEIQGYYFSKPVSATDVVEKLRTSAGLRLSASPGR